MHTPPELSTLPPELLELILLWTVRMCRCEKNKVLPLRNVSKAFNAALKPYVLKTIQLEFSRFLRAGPELLCREALRDIGGFCQAVYLDMMVVRDEGTFNRSLKMNDARVQSMASLSALSDNEQRK